ncbi:MAG: hypothetical protein HYV27_13170 [Candidatus Hydrogenedentes bacterium]|nr:hypothetical protein [Candidatus Hydrogenedentota bacterium]
MAAPEIRWAELDGTLLLQLSGDVRQTAFADMKKSAIFFTFVEGVFSSGTVRRVLIDVEHVVAMDSTHLGLLARLAVLSQNTLGCPPVLYAPTEKPVKLLRAMGMTGLFVLCQEPLAMHVETQALPETGGAATRDAVLTAHRTLAQLNESNREQFKTLIDLLESEPD